MRMVCHVLSSISELITARWKLLDMVNANKVAAIISYNCIMTEIFVLLEIYENRWPTTCA